MLLLMWSQWNGISHVIISLWNHPKNRNTLLQWLRTLLMILAESTTYERLVWMTISASIHDYQWWSSRLSYFLINRLCQCSCTQHSNLPHNNLLHQWDKHTGTNSNIRSTCRDTEAPNLHTILSMLSPPSTSCWTSQTTSSLSKSSNNHRDHQIWAVEGVHCQSQGNKQHGYISPPARAVALPLVPLAL